MARIRMMMLCDISCWWSCMMKMMVVVSVTGLSFQISSDADSVDPLQTHSTTETELDPPEYTQVR